MITVSFSSAFQDLTGGRRAFRVEGRRLSEVFDALEREVPGLRRQLLPAGQIHLAYQLILVRGDEQELCRDLACPLRDGDEVVIAPVITGG